MTKPKKIGKDAIGKTKGVGIIRTRKEAEDYEEWKRKRAEHALKEENEEGEKKKTISSERMIDEKEPRPEGLTPEEFAEMKALAKHKKLKVKKVVLKEEEK